VLIAVADTGSGRTEDALERAFEPLPPKGQAAAGWA
jgi:hypothetical protein